jgi:hypothetical protein
MDHSGFMTWAVPSRWDLHQTPSSEIRLRVRGEKTWNPPLSVRMGFFHCMKPWSPPPSATMSAPGLR